MRKLLLVAVTTGLTTAGLTALAQANAPAGQDAAKTETVRVQRVDMRGKPPFKRRTEVLSAADAAALEAATGRAGKAPAGRPPYTRQR